MGRGIGLVGVVAIAFIVASVLAVRGQSPTGDGAYTLAARDHTASWTLPYKADEAKIERIQKALSELKPGMSPGEAVKLLGEPDVVTDLRKGFYGLSPQEDDAMVQSRDDLGYRLVWYLSKASKTVNLKDRWVALYTARADNRIAGLLTNGIDK